jgi:HAE1 family hydrophobic/amphiphilic exporter-1
MCIRDRFSYQQLSYELLPKFSPPVITIATVYPGASAGEVENSVSRKIEDATATLERLRFVRSISQEGLGITVLEFEQNSKIEPLLAEAKRKVDAIRSDLPKEIREPTIQKLAFDEIPVLRIAATSTLSDEDFYWLLDQKVKPLLARLKGVGNILITGGVKREIKIHVDQEKLKAHKLSLLQVVQAVNNANLDFPTGKVENNQSEFTLRISGKIKTIEELKNLVVQKLPSGATIYLRDLAEVYDGKEQQKTIVRLNGQTAVGLLIQKQSDANAVEVSNLVREELIKIQAAYRAQDSINQFIKASTTKQPYVPVNLNFTIAQDSSTFTMQAADAVMHDIVLAIILVAIVMLLFLHTLRNSFIVMLAIPASFVGTFIGMYLLDFSLNLMTLLGLSLVVGILVDDSIVVLENIYRHLEMGKPPRVAALDGRNEIGFTAMSITLVDVVVFLPLAFVGGIVGNIMREFALVVVVSTLLSLFVSFTITPFLASRIAKLTHFKKGTLSYYILGGFESWFESMRQSYGKLLAWSLRHKAIVFTITIVLFFGSFSFFAMGLIGSEFVAQGDRGEFVVKLEMDQHVSVFQTNQIANIVEKQLLRRPEVKRVYSSIGSGENGILEVAASNLAQLTITLVDKKEREKGTDQIAKEVYDELSKIPGVKVSSVPVSFVTGGADESPISFSLRGSDLATVRKEAARVLDLIANIPGINDIKLSSKEGKPELSIIFNRDKMAALGLSIFDVGATLRASFSGDDNSKFRDGDTDHPIRVVLDQFDRSKIEHVNGLTFLNNRGQLVELRQFATVTQTVGASQLERKERIPSVTVNANVTGRPVGTVGEEIEKAIAAAPLAPGVSFSWEGQIKNQKEGMGGMGTALLISIIFVYLIMVALYDSYRHPLVVLFSIPLAVVGAFLAMALSMSNMSIFTMLGLLMLVGLVCKNAILLVDFTNQARKEGADIITALVQAGKERIRPIVMTTVAMVIGMLPLALAKGAGAEWKNGLAWALVGGLTSSMFLTLLVVPCVYLTFENAFQFFNRIVGGGKYKGNPNGKSNGVNNQIAHENVISKDKHIVENVVINSN